MNFLLRIGSAIILPWLIGCAVTLPPPPLTPTEVAAIDFGAVPDNYQQLIIDYFRQTEPNADASDFRFGEPFKGYLQQGPLFGGKVMFSGYFVDVWFKTAAAPGTTPTEQHVGVVIRNGQVLMQLSPEEMQQVKR